MADFGIYSLKSGILLFLFWGIYMFCFRKDTFFLFNRVFLLGGMVLSLTLPWVRIEYPVEFPLIPLFSTPFIPADLTGNWSEIQTDQSWISLLGFYGKLYLGGVGLLLLYRLIGFRKLFTVIRQYGYRDYEGYNLVVSSAFGTSFSFFHFLFIPESLNDKVEKEIILKHELAHIRQYHWLDLSLCDALKILFWFNPIVWLYGKAVRENHEYLADQTVLESYEANDYLAALVNQWTKMPLFPLSNSFSYSSQIKRVRMIKKSYSPPAKKLFALLIFPFLASFLWFCSEPERIENNNNLTIQIAGKVTDVKGGGIPLASVVVPSQSYGTVSNPDGEFVLNVSPNDTVFFIYPGYTREFIIPKENKQDYAIRLQSIKTN